MKFIGLLAAALLSVSALPTDTSSIASYTIRKPIMADYRLLYDLLKKHVDDHSDIVAHWGIVLLI
jgi:hypothetical protein